MGRTLCRSARAIRVRAGSKRSGAGTGPDVRPAKRRAGSRKGVKATRCKVSAANGAGGVDGGHSGMEAEEEDGPVVEDLGEAPGQSPSATDSSMDGAEVRNHVQKPATQVSGAADTAEAGLITMTMQAPSSSCNSMMGAGAAEAEGAGASGQPAPSALLSRPSHDTVEPAAAAAASTHAPATVTQDTAMAAAELAAEAEASVAAAQPAPSAPLSRPSEEVLVPAAAGGVAEGAGDDALVENFGNFGNIWSRRFIVEFNAHMRSEKP